MGCDGGVRVGGWVDVCAGALAFDARPPHVPRDVSELRICGFDREDIIY